jgi:hypothetical protein
MEMERLEKPPSQVVEDLPEERTSGEKVGEKGTASDVESGETERLTLKNDNLKALKGVLKFGVERRGMFFSTFVGISFSALSPLLPSSNANAHPTLLHCSSLL